MQDDIEKNFLFYNLLYEFRLLEINIEFYFIY